MKTIQVLISIISSCLFTACGNTSVSVKTETDGEILAGDGMATMVFDDDCRVEHGHDKELIDFIRRYPTRGF